MPTPTVWVDTDVLVNWLAKEEEPGGRELWRAPYALACAAEDGSCRAIASLTAILEMRFLLRRKKGWTESFVQSVLGRVAQIFSIEVPDEADLLRANHLQTGHPLDPFDAILLSCALSTEGAVLLTRDKKFLTTHIT